MRAGGEGNMWWFGRIMARDDDAALARTMQPIQLSLITCMNIMIVVIIMT